MTLSSSSSSPSPKKKKIRATGFSRKKSELALSTHDPVTSTKDSPQNNTSIFLQGDGGEWKDGVRLAHKLGFQFPQVRKKKYNCYLLMITMLISLFFVLLG
jgi:hypothetical protein